MSPCQPMGHGSLSQSSPSLSHSGWETLRTSVPFGTEIEATFRSHLFHGPPPVPWPGTWGYAGVPGSLTFPPLTCGSSCFAGAAGCVATLLHDAAMNPAEGNDGPGLLGRGQSGSARASWVPSVDRQCSCSCLTAGVLWGPVAPVRDPGGCLLWAGWVEEISPGAQQTTVQEELGGRAWGFHPGVCLGTVTWSRREGKRDVVGTARVILSVWELGTAVLRSREEVVQLWACVQEED